MKTKEMIFYEATGKQFHRFAYGEKILRAMEEYAAEVIKEKDEKIEALEKEFALFKKNTAYREHLSIEGRDQRDEEIESLRTENEELKRSVELRTGELVVKIEENTALRVLLERARIEFDSLKHYPYVDGVAISQLLSDIKEQLKSK